MEKSLQTFDRAVADGERLVRILRSGYEDPRGKQCRVGEVIALPLVYADAVVKAGAGELVEREAS